MSDKVKIPIQKHHEVQKLVNDYFKSQVAKGFTHDQVVEQFKRLQNDGTPIEIATKASIDIQVATKLISLRDSAARRGKEFALTFKKVKQLLTQKRCHYSGVPFEEYVPGQNDDFIRTIDRVDNKRGYTDDNVVACTKRMNLIKNDYTIEELMAIHNGIFKHYGAGIKAKSEPKIKKLKVS